MYAERTFKVFALTAELQGFMPEAAAPGHLNCMAHGPFHLAGGSIKTLRDTGIEFPCPKIIVRINRFTTNEFAGYVVHLDELAADGGTAGAMYTLEKCGTLLPIEEVLEELPVVRRYIAAFWKKTEGQLRPVTRQFYLDNFVNGATE